MLTAICVTAGVSISITAWAFLKFTAPARKALAESIAKAERDARAEAERGREVNRLNNLKREVYGILTEIIHDPERLRGAPQYPDRHTSLEFESLRRFLTAHRDFEQGLERMKYVADGALRAQEERRAIIATQKDIQKALGMGQPIEQ